jgi:hypothetical protein
LKGHLVARSAGWIRRLGAAGFFFFLAKGLLWLLVPALIAVGIIGRGTTADLSEPPAAAAVVDAPAEPEERR